MIDLALIIESFPKLLEGAMLSLKITLIAMSIGLSLGLLLGFCEESKSKCISTVVFCYVSILRGTPMLVQILFIYYVLPQFGIVIAPFWAASIAIGLNSSAYISQIVRSGLLGVSSGQIEAAKTLGFTKVQIQRYIQFPQVVRLTLPALGNELITLIKDSSLASIIGVMELSKEASIIRGRTYDAFSILLAVSLIYLVMTTALSISIQLLQRRFYYARG